MAENWWEARGFRFRVPFRVPFRVSVSGALFRFGFLFRFFREAQKPPVGPPPFGIPELKAIGNVNGAAVSGDLFGQIGFGGACLTR